MDDSIEVVEGSPGAGVLFLCDHASNAVPQRYQALGLPACAFERHIAYDIGAAALTRRLARMFAAPALLTRYSRLLIDPNRGADDPTLVMQMSDGAIVPGNAGVDEAEIERRRALYWRPYRDAVRAQIDAMTAAGPPPALISMHSFTPAWRGAPRPWRVAVLWDVDARIAAPLIAALRAQGHVVGDNEPYDGALEGDTLFEHGTQRGLPHVLIEARQDLVADEAGVTLWADLLAVALRPLLAEPGLHRVERHGSRATPGALTPGLGGLSEGRT